MRRGWAIFASLFISAAAPLLLGYRWYALVALGADGLAYAMALAGAQWGVPSLFFGGMGLFLIIRLSMIIAAARLPFGPQLPGAGAALLSILTILVADSVLLSVGRTEVAEAFKIPAGSMIPTIEVGDHIYVDKGKTQPQRGDVIVFRYPREPDKNFVKRVIAVGGDTVEWQDETPVVNGHPLARRELPGECHYQDHDELAGRWEERKCRAFEESCDQKSWRIVQDPQPNIQPRASFTVPANSYYVLGDNRDNSHDSRYWGAVPADHVKGTAVWIWWSSGENLRTERIGQKIQ